MLKAKAIESIRLLIKRTKNVINLYSKYLLLYTYFINIYFEYFFISAKNQSPIKAKKKFFVIVF